MSDGALEQNALLPISEADWMAALTVDQFVSKMGAHKEWMRRRLNEVRLPYEAASRFSEIRSVSHISILTSYLCADSLMCIPIVADMVRYMPDTDLRIFVREESPDLTAYFVQRGIVKIPIVSFLGSSFNELALWNERSQSADKRFAEWLPENPEFVELISKDSTLTEEEAKSILDKYTSKLPQDMEAWHSEGVFQDTIDEIWEKVRSC